MNGNMFEVRESLEGAGNLGYGYDIIIDLIDYLTFYTRYDLSYVWLDVCPNVCKITYNGRIGQYPDRRDRDNH
jgi:hypothetical protein